MAESCIAEAADESHKLQMEYNSKRNIWCDTCSVCHSCACETPKALLTPCDDVSWLIDSTTV